VLTQDVLREESGITQFAFRRLLAWLDDGVDSNGERYLEMRRRLVLYFDRRNRPAADELADETLNRIGRTLESGIIATRPPARYCYVVAKFVLLEDVRRARRHVPLEQRDLIVEYYADVRRQKIERRRELAKRLGITMNGLGVRAWRIREGLMECVEGCRLRRRQI
jgi:hypothetical protein